MLNQSGVTTVKATTPKSILWAPENAIAFSCTMGNAGLSPDEGGKKILAAGTPITGDLTARNTPFVKATTSASSNAVGLALHSVDVTTGKMNGTVLVAGVVDLNKLDSTTAAMITADVKKALPNIIFVK